MRDFDRLIELCKNVYPDKDVETLFDVAEVIETLVIERDAFKDVLRKFRGR